MYTSDFFDGNTIIDNQIQRFPLFDKQSHDEYHGKNQATTTIFADLWGDFDGYATGNNPQKLE